MDFFQRQETARRNTKWLEVYFVFAVIGTILAVYALAVMINITEFRDDDESVGVADFWNPELLLGVSMVTGFIILCGSVYKISQLSAGGSVVAEMMNGVPVDPRTTDPGERRLLNVVEEMAIASGTPMPKVYILPGEETINAFAAGHSTSDMVVCVTHGALQYLKRDELQGVIGHEFSHILNGDMRLNLRLMGIVFGIISLVVIGKILLQTRGEKNPLPLVGLALIAIGSIGAFFGKLIKSAVSRQREFLADASSVQFTRNPAGLANALKKVGSGGSRIHEPNAEEASHLFFANGLSESIFEWMSTHPPLEQRIQELDPAWDGQFISYEAMEKEAVSQEIESRADAAPAESGARSGGIPTAASFPAGAGAAIATSAILTQSGAPTARHLDYAASIIAGLPRPLAAASRDPLAATALVYALLVSRDEKLRNFQLQQVEADPPVLEQTGQLLPFAQTLESRARLPLLTLSMTALRHLDADQYAAFAKNLDAIINANKEANLFAYALQKVILRRLAPNFRPSPKPVILFRDLKPLIPDCTVILSALAYAGQTDAAGVEKAFNQGLTQLGLPPGNVHPDPASYDLTKIDDALKRINQATPQIKKTVLSACAETVAADGVILENEAELLRAIADTLDCPIPPFLDI
ncbi:MAG TPA: M48 family metallopeptidase [Candidatus Methylacidiphilales bacterium]|nr:M48 family metallopeptidase [Candidatus Methylacidiphilales bacterium]